MPEVLLKSKHGFASDNNAGIHPEILDAIARANQGHVRAYGDDDYTRAALMKFEEHFGPGIDAFFTFNGTGANVLGLQALNRPYHAVLCSDYAHIYTDECAAPEKHTGCKLIPLPHQDGKITAEDFGLLQRASYNALLAAVEKKDDDWIWNNYFHVTSAWLKEHFELEPNKTRLLRINVPVFIFQGEDDNHTPVEGVYDIKERFTKGNKTNLQCFIFKSHDHDLNYLNWPKKKLISEGLQKIFEISAQY